MFDALGAAIEAVDIPLEGDALVALLALRDRLDARIAEAVGAFDVEGSWALDGATSMTAWLADRARMARPRAAHEAARARKTRSLPAMAGRGVTGCCRAGRSTRSPRI